MEKRIKRWFKKERNGSDLVLFHHRFPTSTVNVKRAAHPFNTGDHFGNVKYVLVHNGVISNPKDLKPEHEKLGINYQSVLQDGTYNDSEALLWDFALTMEGQQEELKVYGGIAFICIKLVDDVPEKLYFGRNYGRPLKLFRGKDGIMLSSEGIGDEIEAARLYTYNYKLNRMTHKFFRIPSYDSSKWNSNWDDRATTSVKRIADTASNNACSQDSYYIDDYGHAVYDDDDSWNENEYWDENTLEWKNYRNTHASRLPDDGGSRPTIIGEILTKPSEQQINSFLFRHIGEASGHYDTTYWALSLMHEDLEMKAQSINIKRELELIEHAMIRICDDPSYIDETSYHPLWVVPEEEKISINPSQEELAKILGDHDE